MTLHYQVFCVGSQMCRKIRRKWKMGMIQNVFMEFRHMSYQNRYDKLRMAILRPRQQSHGQTPYHSRAPSPRYRSAPHYVRTWVEGRTPSFHPFLPGRMGSICTFGGKASRLWISVGCFPFLPAAVFTTITDKHFWMEPIRILSCFRLTVSRLDVTIDWATFEATSCTRLPWDQSRFWSFFLLVCSL